MQAKEKQLSHAGQNDCSHVMQYAHWHYLVEIQSEWMDLRYGNVIHILLSIQIAIHSDLCSFACVAYSSLQHY